MRNSSSVDSANAMITPKMNDTIFAQADVRMFIDTPRAQQIYDGAIRIAGWALDRQSLTDSGVVAARQLGNEVVRVCQPRRILKPDAAVTKRPVILGEEALVGRIVQVKVGAVREGDLDLAH